MKPLCFKNVNKMQIIRASLTEGKALVRGIFTGACFSKKEIVK